MAETEKDGGQVYPAAWGNPEQGGDYVPGMSLRDWFAGQAVRARWGNGHAMMPEDAAQMAYQLADAMLIARATGEKEPAQ